MKISRYIFLSILISLSSLASAEVPDTLMVVDFPSKVLITESPEGTRITVTDTVNGTQNFHFVEYAPGAKVSTSRKSTKSIINIPGFDCINKKERCGCSDTGWAIGIDGLCVGLNQAHGQTGDGGLQWSKSFEISWLSCLNVGYAFSRSRLYIGLGFDWRNYKATADGKWLVPSSAGGIEWGRAPEGSRVKSSNLKVFSLQLPFMYEWRVPKSWLELKLGPILNFNTYASLKGLYDDAAGNHCEYFRKDFDRRKVTVDFFGAISYHSALGIYVRYSPMKVLNDASPINFTPFTLGFTFLL